MPNNSATPGSATSGSATSGSAAPDPQLPTPRQSPLKKIPRRVWFKIILAALITGAVVAYLVWDILAHGPLTALLTNRDELVAAVESWGPFAPLIYVFFQVLQTVVAPIPGQVVGSIGGFIFGIWGILWTSIGTLIGCWIVFKLARRFGRPLLEKLFKKSAIEKFDFIIDAKGTSFVLFLIFLLPGFPDDIVCYIAGLTKLPIKRLMFLVILGRFPVIVLTNYIGARVGTNFTAVVIVAVAAVIVLGLVAWQRERIITFLKGENSKSPTSANPKDLNPTNSKSPSSTKPDKTENKH